MPTKTDPTATAPRPIADLASALRLRADEWRPYGHDVAKVDPACSTARGVARLRRDWSWSRRSRRPPRARARRRPPSAWPRVWRGIGESVCLALREPSLGPVLGMKGGATGGGRSQLVPAERINLHFTGDFHAITSAHNLLAALLDNHLYYGNALRIDPRRVLWRRVIDMNDRALRDVIVGLGGHGPGRAARDRLRHHRGVRGDGDALPGRERGRPARAHRPHCSSPSPPTARR